MNDHIGKRILNLHTTDFEAQEDGIRKPLKTSYMNDKKLKEAAKLEGKTGKLFKILQKIKLQYLKLLK